MSEMTVATVNCMLEDEHSSPANPPQSARAEAIAASISDLDVQPDIVVLSEVHNDPNGLHCGQVIAENAIGVSGVWENHSRGGHEHIGVFGEDVDRDDVTFHPISPPSAKQPRKAAVVTAPQHNAVVAGLHLSYGLDPRGAYIRAFEVLTLLSVLRREYGEYSRKILIGDFNEPAMVSPSRALLHLGGYYSALGSGSSGRQRPPTINTTDHDAHLKRYQQAVMGAIPFSPDDVYTKGVIIQDGGAFQTSSDHNGVWAKLAFNK